MRHSIAPTALLALALAPALPAGAAAAPASPQGEQGSWGDLGAIVEGELAQAGERSLPEIWQRVLALRDAARLGGEGQLDQVLDARLGQPQDLAPRAVLLASAARLQGDDADLHRIYGALSPLIGSADDELAEGVATVFQNPAFRGLRPERDELVQACLDAAQDASRSPAYRLSFAKAAYVQGQGRADKGAARDVMRDFLRSDDGELRAQGALALASAGAAPIEDQLERELEALAEVPDERGELAASYLERERLREHFERKMKDLRRSYEQDEVPNNLVEFDAVLEMIEREHLEGSRVTRDELVEAAMDGMLRWMDPHSSFMSSEVYAKFFQDLEAEYSGIGAYVNEDPDNGLFTIIRPIYSGPAYHAGLKTDDKIVRIDDWPTLGQPTDDIIKRLKGKPGTTVKLYVWRRGMDAELIDRPTEDMIVEVERASIDIPSGTSQLLPGGVGLVELDDFSKKAMRDVKRDIQDMQANGMRALVLDLRANSGGLLTQAVDVAELFLPHDSLVVSTQGRDRPLEQLSTHDDPVVPADMPVAILTGRFTASAAEIVSGALQDHHRAQLVGKRTFGKGSVQQLMPLLRDKLEEPWSDENGNGYWDPWEPFQDRDGDATLDYAPRVKLTIAKYLLPSGRSIHRELDEDNSIISEGGVEPDYSVDAEAIERWEYEALRDLDKDGGVMRYVDEHWDDNHELFTHLAVNDGKDPSLYPDFEAFYAGLGTPLDKNAVRRALRAEIRRRVQDDRGAAFPRGDFVEDVQLQKAIQVVLEELGEEPQNVTEFGLVFDFERMDQEAGPPQQLAVLGGMRSRELDRARALIQSARDGESLSKEQLEEVLSILEEIEN